MWQGALLLSDDYIASTGLFFFMFLTRTQCFIGAECSLLHHVVYKYMNIALADIHSRPFDNTLFDVIRLHVLR